MNCLESKPFEGHPIKEEPGLSGYQPPPFLNCPPMMGQWDAFGSLKVCRLDNWAEYGLGSKAECHPVHGRDELQEEQ